jgi:hypothetical protein
VTNARASRAKRAAAPITASRAVKISVADMERHRRMVAGVLEAQDLQRRANDLAAAFRVWAEELHERYDLDATRGESVNEDGTIVRADDG